MVLFGFLNFILHHLEVWLISYVFCSKLTRLPNFTFV